MKQVLLYLKITVLLGIMHDTSYAQWAGQFSIADNQWYDVAYGAGRFVAVAQTGNGNRVMHSMDGINWSTSGVTGVANEAWRGITYANGQFVAVAQTGSQRVITSTNGLTWTARNTPTDANWQSVSYGNGVYVVVGRGIGNVVMTSSDAINWTTRTPPYATPQASVVDWNDIVFGEADGLFAAVNSGGGSVVERIMTSSDGVTWTLRTNPSGAALNTITYGNGRFVAPEATGDVSYSDNGMVWSHTTTGSGRFWRGSTFANGLFLVVAVSGTGNRAMRSFDGITWTLESTPADNSWYSVVYGNGILVAVSIDGVANRVMTKDGGAMYLGGDGKGDTRALGTESMYLNDKLFTGNTSTDFSLGANWTGGTFPSSETGIVPSTATRQPVLSGSQTITAGTTVSVLEGASLTIAPTGLLAVNGVLNNTGTVTLQSNATGSGGIGNSSGTITGNITVERFIPAVARRYRMYAPPITNFDYSQLIDDIFVTGPSGGTGFDPTTHANNPSIFTYQQDTIGGRGWKSFNNINTILANGTGAVVFVRGDRTLPAPQWFTPPYVAQNAVTLDVTGTIRSGSVTTALQYTNTNDVAKDGWNLVGNPYACAVDWSAITKNNITPFYYIYNPSSASFTVSNSGKIESGQAFFVQATASGASLIFNESSKTTTGGAGLFKTKQNPFAARLIRDAITYDEAVLQFSPTFNKGFNYQEDAVKMEQLSSLAISFLNNHLKLHVNSVSYSQPNVSDTFVMNINGSTGSYSLRLSNVNELPADKYVFLTDTWLNTVYPIAADTTLQINITSDNASKGARFMLTFQPNTSLPAKLIAFSGNHEPGKGNRLFWTTASEENVREFIVERRNASDDIFTPIGAAMATGKVNALTNYTYLDADADLTQPYIDYRLRTTDFSGLSELSEIISINVSAESDQPIAQMYPNPVKQGENVLVQYNNRLKGKITALKVYNASGVLMESADKTVEAFSTANLPAGVYMVQVWLGAAKEMIKLVVF